MIGDVTGLPLLKVAANQGREVIERMDEAIAKGETEAILQSNLVHSRDKEVDLEVGGQTQTIKNDKVIILIGTLPPIEFLMDTGMELDGIWNSRRVVWSVIGILVGIFLYFGAKSFVLNPEDAGGKYLWQDLLFVHLFLRCTGRNGR